GDGVLNVGDYVLFYANGPIGWVKNDHSNIFNHITNIYSDSSFYFLTVTNGNGKRISSQNSPGTATVTVNSYNAYQLHEKDSTNIGGMGKIWWGERFGIDPGFSANRQIQFQTPGAFDTLNIQLAVAATRIGSHNFNVS